MTLQEAFDLFMYEQRFRNNADATIEYYQLSLGLFLDFVGADQSVDVLDISVYKDYVISLQTGGHLKSTSINTYIRAVKAFYNWLIDDDRIGDCSRKLKLIKQKREKIIPLSDDELQRLLNCFDCSDLLQLRNKCLTLLMVDCGLRRARLHDYAATTSILPGTACLYPVKEIKNGSSLWAIMLQFCLKSTMSVLLFAGRKRLTPFSSIASGSRLT